MDHRATYYKQLAKVLRERHHISWRRALRAVGEDSIYQSYRVERWIDSLAEAIADKVKKEKIK